MWSPCTYAILYRPVAVKGGNETTGDPAQDQICQRVNAGTLSQD